MPTPAGPGDSTPAGSPGTALPSGWEALDGLLRGGWPAGALTEITGRGRCSLGLAAVRQAQARGQPVAWVDGPGTFCPPTAGVDLARLTLVAPVAADAESGAARAGPVPACLAADLLLRSRGFGLLVLDLPASRPSLAVCFRLARQASAAQSVLLLLSGGRAPVTGSAAALLLAVRQRHARCAHWMLPPAPALEVTVLRQRGGARSADAAARTTAGATAPTGTGAAARAAGVAGASVLLPPDAGG